MKHATAGDTRSKPAISHDRFPAAYSGAVFLFVFALSDLQAIAIHPYERKELNDALRCSEMGDYGQSARILRNLHKHHPNDAFILTKLGDAYMNNIQNLSCDAKLAEKCFKRAIEIDPEYGEPYAKLAECADECGDFELGIKLRAFLKEHYEDQLVYREVACLEGMNKPDEALKTLNQLILHNKQDDAAYLTRARLNEKQGKHKEAIADYTTAYDLQPSTNVLKERALIYDKMGRKDLAEKDRRQAERL